MGIAKFYSWLKNKRYRGSLQRYVPQNVSSFSFDLNGLIHNVAQKVYAYGNGEDPVRKKLIEKMDPKMLEAEYHLALGMKLAEVIAAVQPRDTLILAVDGVAPQAKIAQQRQRRFRSAMESSGKEIFNSSAITPGTEFMKRLDNYLQRWIIGAKNTLPPKVIYSSHMVSGEGEHKIFAMMRNGDLVGDGAHVVYGMDADLIMLSMLAPLDRIYLMREDLTDVIDIDNLKSGIREELNSKTAIEDFVVMIFLIGNDFLPHLPTLNDMEEAIDTMIRIYKVTGQPLTDGKEINWKGFSTYLAALASEEPRLLELESTRDVMYPSRMMQQATTKTEVITTGKIGRKVTKTSKFEPSVFRAAWYENAFGLKGPKANQIFTKLIPNYTFGATNSKIVEMTKSYLTGISWVYRYYTSGKDFVNNDYVYRFLFAPLISDISAVSEKFSVPKESYEFNKDAIEINPVHQLLSVLPLKSKNLLPFEVEHLMNLDSMIGDYYPETQILERDGYNTDWQGTLLINFVDMKRIKDAVERTSVFTPDRIKEFSPVMTIVLVKDKNIIELERKAKKLESYLTSKKTRYQGGRGQSQSSQGRGYSSQRGQQQYSKGRGRGYSQSSQSSQSSQGRGYSQYPKGKDYKKQTQPKKQEYQSSKPKEISVQTKFPLPYIKPVTSESIAQARAPIPIKKFEI